MCPRRFCCNPWRWSVAVLGLSVLTVLWRDRCRTEPPLRTLSGAPWRGPEGYATRQASCTTSVLVDTDPSLAGYRDVDDVLAVEYLAGARTRNLHLTCLTTITTTFGNTGLEASHATAEHVIKQIHPATPNIYKGAEGPGLLPGTATRNALTRHRGVVLCIGPLTNIAAVLADLARRGQRPSWTKLILLGGESVFVSKRI